MDHLDPFTLELKCSRRADLNKTIYPSSISNDIPISLKIKSPPSKFPKTTITQKAYKTSLLSLCTSTAPCLIELLSSFPTLKFITKDLNNDKLVSIFDKLISLK